MHYRQISYEERCCIAESLESEPEITISEIARRLGRSKSTISEEISRNSRSDGRYLACLAEERAQDRAYQVKGAYKKDNPYILEEIGEGLSKKWSPCIISACLKEKYPEDRRMQMSHQTIYEIIWEDKAFGGSLYKQLPHGKRKRRKRYGKAEKRGEIRNRVSIDERPPEVDEKIRIGDWEGDTIQGCKGGGALLSFVERSQQYVILDLLKDGTAESLNQAVRRAFRRHGPLPCHTLTVDNGKEFAQHEKLAQYLKLDVYFAHPYHAWERGLNEQINGMVRWWFPKGTDFSKVSRAEVREVERLLNERPRKTLGYRSPAKGMDDVRVRLQI